jgi:thioredoxin 1
MKIFANTVVALSAVVLLTTPSALGQEAKQSSEMPPTAPPLESLDSALNKLQSGSANQFLPPAGAAPASEQGCNTPAQAGSVPSGTQLAHAQSLPFPMLYVYEFSAKWCPSCRKLEPITEATANRYRDFIQYSPVNVDNNQELAQQYNVAQIPTVIVVDRQGRMLNRLVGLQQGEQLEQILQHYKQKALAAVGGTTQ